MKIKSTIMLVAILLVISCNNKSNLSQQKNKTANSPKEHPAMKNPSIEAQMVNSKSKEDGMQIVKITVLKLNELNKNSGWELIETEEREAIAAIIIAVGHNKGYNSMAEDITEEWREW
jgi:hypothetical protein